MFVLNIDLDDPCGCGRNRSWKECCLQGGQIQVNPKRVIPPGPPTGKSKPKCLLALTNDCEGKMSGEHILAAAVLRAITQERITVATSTGHRHHWINSRSLTTKRLCERHNTSLGPLDEDAARLFRAIQEIDRALAAGTIAGQRLRVFHGLDLERWMVKTMCALFHSRRSTTQPGTHALPENIGLALHHELAAPYGLYIPVRTVEGGPVPMTIAPRASIALISVDKTVVGLDLSMAGLDFRLVVAGGTDRVAVLAQTHAYRPKFINFFQGSEVFALGFAWSSGSGQTVWISRGDPSADLPTNVPRS